MNLRIRTIQRPGRQPVLALCDEAGEMLPNQQEIALHYSTDDAARITVTFVIDGRRITNPET